MPVPLICLCGNCLTIWDFGFLLIHLNAESFLETLNDNREVQFTLSRDDGLMQLRIHIDKEAGIDRMHGMQSCGNFILIALGLWNNRKLDNRLRKLNWIENNGG